MVFYDFFRVTAFQIQWYLVRSSSLVSSMTSIYILVNRSLKVRIEELADQYIDEHELECVEGKCSVSQRRVLLTKWVGQA
jgi:hypothetical protein